MSAVVFWTLVGLAVIVTGGAAASRGQYPSRRFARALGREIAPTAEEEASQFYRRGQKYNAIGGLKGTHAFAFVFAIVTLPLFLLLRLGERFYAAGWGSREGPPKDPASVPPDTPTETPDQEPPATTQAVAAGWYADPLGIAALRWWTGTSWSEHTAAPPPAPDA